MKGFTESERAVALLGLLVLACALTLPVAWELHVQAQRDELRALVAKNAATGTPQQLASDMYHLGHFEESLASRWWPGGHAMLGATAGAIGAALIVVPVVRVRRRRLG